MTYANPDALVSTDWLADHLDDPDVVVVDVHLDPSPYQQAHIPGAVFWQAIGTLLHNDFSTNFDTAHAASLLGSAGITNRTTIVATSEHLGMAPWLYWYLTSIGHDDVRVLDGGNRKWAANSRPMTADVPKPTPTTYRPGEFETRYRASLDDVASAVGSDACVLLDVRTVEEFQGELFMLEPATGTERSGHIPGATHLYYEAALAPDGTFLPADELAAVYQAAGLSSDSSVITYCAVGMRAGHSWFVLSELLGFPDVANYDLSWNEWGRRADTSIE